MKKIALFLSLAVATFFANAQNEVDALRYSLTDMLGSARSQGMGGAFGALGADFSSFMTNPAGIGVYKMNEAGVGFAFNENLSSSRYQGITTETSRANFNFNHFGLVQVKEIKDSKWVSTTFGITYNRTRTFHENFTIKGSDQNTTFLDVLALQGTGVHPDAISDAFPFGAGLAYETYLIDPTDSLGTSYTPVVNGGNVDQLKTIRRRGFSSQTSLGFGANYDDRLYLGMTIAFNGFNFSEDGSYSEGGFENTNLQSYNFVETLESSGLGINFKIGVIGKPTEWLRIGVAVHSPNYIGIQDSYTADMSSSFSGNENYNWSSPTGAFAYNLRTPARYLGNIAFVLGKSGVVSADYEYSDYSNINMRSSANDLYTYDFIEENRAIRTIYRGVHKVRAGAEWRIPGDFRVRAGAGYEQSPFANGAANNAPWVTLTGGVGYRGDHFFTDLAVTHQQREEDYYLYDPAMVAAANIASTRTQVLWSIGVRF